jgi:hypothetical protein
MKRLILATLALLPLTTGTFAQSISTVSPVAVHRAPGPLLGAGPVGLVIAGVCVYWVAKRRRSKAIKSHSQACVT